MKLATITAATVLMLISGNPVRADEHEDTAPSNNSRHIVLDSTLTLKTLEQNWSHKESNDFYNAAQGSRLVPYEWMLHLERHDTNERFLSNNHVRELGFLPREKSEGNPDGLPIGFIRDAEYDSETPGMGVTCAACHTGLITYKQSAYLIDGGPTLGNMEELLKRLASALETTAKDEAKFARFADAMLEPWSTQDDRLSLRILLEQVAEERNGYNERNLSQGGAPSFGHGRVDAFGAILNEVSANFLGIPENAAPATAPVSYPCLWDAPQHDHVQWNGSASNAVLDKTALFKLAAKEGLDASLIQSFIDGLGIDIDKLIRMAFGTNEIGALGRNTGEVMGVFGSVDITRREHFIPRRYDSTANKKNLLAIEDSLKTLWSPLWPEDFPEINKERAGRGKAIYHEHCVDCHKPIVRDDPRRRVVAEMSACGTDSTLHDNFLRTGETGRLRGRRRTLVALSSSRFGKEAPVSSMLKHTVERAILNEIPSTTISKVQKMKELASKLLDMKLTPDFESHVKLSKGTKVVNVPLQQVEKVAGRAKLRLVGKSSTLRKVARGLGLSQESVKSQSEDTHTLEVPAQDLRVEVKYKARPLNGVWATAPYLHNGSVPNLMELLKPANKRIKKFHVGSTEFDPANVGFKSDPNFPEFDTTTIGNSNQGHEFGAELNKEQRLDLIEYLKTL